jgi:hypothetical protein
VKRSNWFPDDLEISLSRMPTLQVQGCHRIPADAAATFERAGRLVLLEAPDHSTSFFLAPRIGRSKLGASIVRFNQKGLSNFMG